MVATPAHLRRTGHPAAYDHPADPLADDDDPLPVWGASPLEHAGYFVGIDAYMGDDEEAGAAGAPPAPPAVVSPPGSPRLERQDATLAAPPAPARAVSANAATLRRTAAYIDALVTGECEHVRVAFGRAPDGASTVRSYAVLSPFIMHSGWAPSTLPPAFIDRFQMDAQAAAPAAPEQELLGALLERFRVIPMPSDDDAVPAAGELPTEILARMQAAAAAAEYLPEPPVLVRRHDVPWMDGIDGEGGMPGEWDDAADPGVGIAEEDDGAPVARVLAWDEDDEMLQ